MLPTGASTFQVARTKKWGEKKTTRYFFNDCDTIELTR